MKNIITLAFVCLINYSCGDTNNKITIKGEIKNSRLEKVYLTDAYDWKVLLDSSLVINDLFSFARNHVDYRMYSIFYKDSLGALHSIEFINRVLSPDKVKYLTNYFLLDSPTIFISGDWATNKDHYYEVQGGQENKALFRTQMIEFGYLDTDPIRRNQQLEEYTYIIRTYPNSQYLLQKLNENKSVIKKSELAVLLKEFNPTALNTELGKQLSTYLVNKKEVVKINNLTLLNNEMKQSKLYDTSAKINMIVVWASWCGPCRQEIPIIKKLHNLYGKKGLTITSVSIDEDKSAWKSALLIERMQWNQLIVSESTNKSFNAELEVGSIPYVLFLTGDGYVIDRSIGLVTNTVNEYERIIEKYTK